jgi:hypothetical protein
MFRRKPAKSIGAYARGFGRVAYEEHFDEPLKIQLQIMKKRKAEIEARERLLEYLSNH